MRRIVISYMDGEHQYDIEGNAITTWNSKYCNWVINKDYENSEIDWVEDENGITEFPRGFTEKSLRELYPNAENFPEITVTWFWKREGFEKFFKEKLDEEESNYTEEWSYLDYNEGEALELGKYCNFNEEAYRTVIKYNNKIIFDGKL